MRIEAPIFVDDDYARQPGGGGAARIGAERADEIAADLAVAVGRGDGDVVGADPLVVLGDLLAQRIVRHQGLDDRRGGQAGGVAADARREGPPIDLAVDEAGVEVDRFGRNLLLVAHGGLP
jgi:hypothetical protein